MTTASLALGLPCPLQRRECVRGYSGLGAKPSGAAVTSSFPSLTLSSLGLLGGRSRLLYAQPVGAVMLAG